VSELFNSDLFNNDVFNVGDDDQIAIIEQRYRPPNIDFIVTPGYLRLIEVYRRVAESTLPKPAERSELSEMTEIYDLYMKSPTRTPIWPQA